MAEDKMQKKVRVTNAKDGKTSYVTYQDLVNGVYANLSHIGIRNLASSTDTNPTYTKYTKNQIVTYLGNPANYEKQLRNMSKYLFNILRICLHTLTRSLHMDLIALRQLTPINLRRHIILL